MIHEDSRDGVRVLRWDAPPLNMLTESVLEATAESVARANADPDVRAIVIAGTNQHFSAGADIHLFQQIASDEDAMRLAERFQRAFDQLERSEKPLVAALAGHVLGGALELALACHYRVATRTTRFSMPEVRLGINPGAGGTQRLPRLIGVSRALDMLLSGRAVRTAEAASWGLVDQVAPSDDLLDAAQALASRVHLPRRTSELSLSGEATPQHQAAFAPARQQVAATHSDIVAPRKILELVQAACGDSWQDGLKKERRAFAQCMATRATRHKIGHFFAVRQVAKIEEVRGVQPVALSRVSVIGLGTMGVGICLALLRSGLEVTALDVDSQQLDRGTEKIAASLERQVRREVLSQAAADGQRARFTTTANWSDLPASPLVIETVPEDLDVKRAVLKQLETVSAATTILASNTSTYSLASLAQGMRFPDRLIGLHFFNPAHRMPLLEVVRRPSTPRGVLATAIHLARQLHKTPLLVNDCEGFLVDRIFVPYLQEAFQLVEEGARLEDVDRAAVGFGFPMGPLILIDMAGLDILVQSHDVLQRAVPRFGPLSSLVRRLVVQGHVGQKTGAGVYRYDEGSSIAQTSAITTSLLDEVRQTSEARQQEFDQDAITDRLVMRMINEAFYAREDGIARSDLDVDVASVLGFGFPDFRGGVLRYASDIGLASVLERLEEFADRHGPRYHPSQHLRQRIGVT
jgi:3-hydroxyacyl-CoA dehydrogenase